MKTYLTLVVLFVSSQAFALTDTTRYSIVTTEKIAGKQLVWSDEPGKVSYWYEFNDRGRGPKLRVDLTIVMARWSIEK